MNSRNIQGNASIHKDDLKGKNKKKGINDE